MIERVTMTGSNLMGMPVKNEQGEALGVIKDVLIDMQSSIVAYFVLHYEDTNKGIKYFAVPVEALAPAEGQSYLLMPLKRKDLDSHEGYDPANPPIKSDSFFLSHIHSHYKSNTGMPSRPSHG